MDGFVSGGRAGERIRRNIDIPETIRRLNKKCNFAVRRLNLFTIEK